MTKQVAVLGKHTAYLQLMQLITTDTNMQFVHVTRPDQILGRRISTYIILTDNYTVDEWDEIERLEALCLTRVR